MVVTDDGLEAADGLQTANCRLQIANADSQFLQFAICNLHFAILKPTDDAFTSASQARNRRQAGHQSQQDRDGKIHRAVKKRAARIEIERHVRGQRAGGKDGHDQHDHLPDFQALRERVAEEPVAQKHEDAPQQRIHQAAGERANHERHAE